MNNDPTAASDPARLPPTLDDRDSDAGSQDEGDQYRRARSDDEGQDNVGEGSSHRQDTQNPRRSRGRRRRSSKIRRAKAGIAKKLDFMTHLMSSLDVVIFAELCILYYMDCSFIRLVMRALVQYMYLTPKPEEFVKLMPPPRPQMYTVFGSNGICMLVHLIFSLPEAGETMRGYLHGGVIIDFIGQKAPTSRLSLLLLDCLILILQCVMCAIWMEKDRLKRIETTLKNVSAGGVPKTRDTTTLAETSAAVDVLSGAPTSTQDLDSEERGVMRDDPLGANQTTDIEMQPLMRDQPPGDADSGGTGDSGIMEARFRRILRTAGGSDATEGPSRPSLLDVLLSGNALLVNLHVPHAIRTLVADNASDPSGYVAGYPLRLTGYGTRIAQLAAESQVRLERARQQRS
ncbi:hypothetical protein N0V93_003967 [Gnomoniopsis smithogilvyi]|uniref:DUF1746 domain-containing protein n=1 Tax=Gnomoniopsis smithogilvyi TaxID=1191159 RepID=A0A9W8YZN7_9PEZI|nr:hypothetical protein N0V93_003967 [Gnomoniopsis smithogilvyi]